MRHSRLLWIGALVVALGPVGHDVVVPSPAGACIVGELPSLAEMIADGAVVFRGEAVRRRPAEYRGGGQVPEYVTTDYVVFDVEETTGRDVPSMVAVLDLADGASTTCGSQQFHTEQTYLVLGTIVLDDDRLLEPIGYPVYSSPLFVEFDESDITALGLVWHEPADPFERTLRRLPVPVGLTLLVVLAALAIDRWRRSGDQRRPA